MNETMRGMESMAQLPGNISRRMNSLARVAIYAADPRLYPTCQPVRTYWWTGHPNFGDELTRVVLPLAGMAPLLKPARSADFFGVGSIIELIPEAFSGWVWGSGKMYQEAHTTLPQAKFLAVRGAKTRELLGLPADTPLGDPGLLVSRVYRPRPRRKGVAIVPHFSHRGLPEIEELRARLGADSFDVDVTQAPRRVIRRIASAELVVTTSLHGLIVADAYGIPAVWALPEPTLAGGDFKFRDHESALFPAGTNRRMNLADVKGIGDLFALARSSDLMKVDDLQQRLLNALTAEFGATGRRVLPLALPWKQFRV